MAKSWIVREPDLDAEAQLARELRVTPLTARCLAARGFADPKEADAFLGTSLRSLHDPFLLEGMTEAADRIMAALAGGERIAVFGDYDVDGVTGAALLISFLREVGADPIPYVPSRFTEGYGLTEGAVRTLAERGARVLITVDCGVASVEPVEAARALGVDVIVCDHHEPGAALPRALALLNPKLPGSAFPFSGICGTGVAFKLATAVRKALRDAGRFDGGGEPNLRRYLDLVALATVADLVPLRDENRAFVKYGLEELVRAERPGLRALLDVAGVDPLRADAGTLGFQLGPRINAAGRLGEGMTGLALLTAPDAEAARPLARKLDDENRRRREIEREMAEEAAACVEREADWTARRSLVYGSERWHQGVVGIVASRLVERFHRPAILVAFEGETGRGSGRAIEGFHLLEALDACAGRLETYGGHKQAAGLTIRRDRFEAFRDDFERAAGAALSPEALRPRIKIDAEATFRDLSPPFAEELDRMAPFGLGNPRPTVVVRDVAVRSQRRIRGDGVKLKVSQDGRDLDAVMFRAGPRPPAPGDRMDVVCAPEINTFGGGRRLELTIKDFRVA